MAAVQIGYKDSENKFQAQQVRAADVITESEVTAEEHIGDSSRHVSYATCSTAAATAAKTVDCAGFNLTTGARVTVMFTVTNTAASPTLNVNNTGAKAIYYRNAAISAGTLAANRVYDFVYDGTQWELVGDVNVDTTYSAMSVDEGSAGTATTNRVMRSDYLKAIIKAIAVSVGADGKIDPSLIPQQAITDVFEASSDAEMTALSSAHVGDVCIRSDVNKTYILKQAPYSTLANWVQLPIPQDLVLSVAGKTGAVTLTKSDVGLGNVDNTADSAKSVASAASAAKLTTTRSIDGVSFDGTAAIVHYATCSTAAATAEKTLAITGFTLVTGAVVLAMFTVTNTATNPTLNVNGTGAKAIYYRNAAISAGTLAANRVYAFVFDGSQWELVGDTDSYTAMTQAEAEAGTATETRVIAPNILKSGVEALAPLDAAYCTSEADMQSKNLRTGALVFMAV
jgi:hypothetical protein